MCITISTLTQATVPSAAADSTNQSPPQLQDPIDPSLQDHCPQVVNTTSAPAEPYIPSAIDPCSIMTNGQPSLFHLLTCGHIVAVDEHDRRCGANCLHAAVWVATPDETNTSPGFRDTVPNDAEFLFTMQSYIPRPYIPVLEKMVPAVTPKQLGDDLYCEVCNGIPFERYIIMFPPASEFDSTKTNPRLRRCLSLTRPIIAAATDLPDTVVQALLCSPFVRSDYWQYLGGHAHTLRCKHTVWSKEPRRCGCNCVCGETVMISAGTAGGVVICDECVFRAELVTRRWKALGSK
ncbi:hypothetical protein BDW02DRAFT_596930 [Decorospora gaudefroyi]|uniref:Uncharacterized protein n=1 Tax=Decorospora gaudefroyi TaxID=184978 RepID=A0A6A5KIY7_9PLEO|nr:hypothetical protein BDW02DRAFT_596930 [Decorospora gaudefroyi]